MFKIMDFLIEHIIQTVFILAALFGVFMGWIFTKDYYQNNVLSEKQEYILMLEQDKAEQQEEMKVYKNKLEEAESTIEWMTKALEIYESQYGCF